MTDRRSTRKSNNDNKSRAITIALDIVVIITLSVLLYFMTLKVTSLIALLTCFGAVILVGILAHALINMLFDKKNKADSTNRDSDIRKEKEEQGKSLLSHVIFICALIATTLLVLTITSMNELSNQNIYDGISVGKNDLSMISYDDALVLVTQEESETLAGISLDVYVDENKTTFSAEQLGFSSDAVFKLNEAYNYGHFGSIFQKLDQVLKLRKDDFSLEIRYFPDETLMDSCADEVYTNFSSDPADATMSFDPSVEGGFAYTSEVVGKTLNKDDVLNAIKIACADLKFEDVHLYTTEIAPSLTLSQLKSQVVLLASQTTDLEDDDDRTSNVALAGDTIEVVLQPDEVFSFNTITGERTLAKGYKVAHAIADGSELIDSVAGGVCQVASTVYSAILDTDIEIVERYNHSFKVSYLPTGRDATVDFYTDKDFKFKNTTGYPVYISCYVTYNEPDEYGETTNNFTVEVYGTVEDSSKRVEARVETISSFAGGYATSFSSKVATGATVVVKKAINGKKSETYRDYYVNGELVESVLVSEDYYKAVQGKKIYGCG